MDNSQPHFQPPTSAPQPTVQTGQKPAVIGLYGLPGSGKSFLLKQLKKQLSHCEYDFYEGSEMISALVPGALEAFKSLREDEQRERRERAIGMIAENCRQRGKTAIVTGHFMFWSDGESKPVYTKNDMNTYTLMLYLDKPAEMVLEQRLGDGQRPRQAMTVEALERWQKTEIDEMTRLCQEHGILFSRLPKQPTNQLLAAFKLIQYSRRVSIVPNTVRIDSRISEVLLGQNELETMVVVDADKTLSTEDTGTTFWDIVMQSQSWSGSARPLHSLFSGPLRYSETAFLQATLLYEEATDEDDFETTCEIVASKTQMHAEFISLFRLMASQHHVRALVVTSGIRRVWEKILEREGFSQTVKVIGGARISDDVVVTAEVKAHVVTWLRKEGQLHVCAIGDGPLDLPMLEAADEAIVITGEERNRSRSMDYLLSKAIEIRRLKVRQVLLPRHDSPRLTNAVLPQICLDDEAFLASVLSRRSSRLHPNIWHATNKNAAKLLMSPTRDASVAGPMLRKAHGNIGVYISWEFLSELLGVEEYSMQHVQGHEISGHRICHESKTTIVALMRGGEPLALGLNEAMPLAMFVHASSPNDIKRDHLDNQKTVILADSVINSGETLMQFIKHTRKMHKDIRIVALAGVVQVEAVRIGHALAEVIEHHNVQIGALRLSENKFTGFKGTDTGHRLFNTTHMA